MKPARVLIVGAGLAGSAAARQLDRIGWEVTLVEPTHVPPESYLLQLDDTAQRLLADLGASDIVRDASAPSPAISARWGDRRLRRTSFSSGTFRLGRRREIIAAMHAHVPLSVDQRFGVRLDALEFAHDRVTAVLSDGTRASYDLVVGADGLNSTVRRIVYGPDSQFLYRNGVSHVWFKVPTPLPRDMAVIASRENVALQIYPYPDRTTTQVLAAVELSRDAHLSPEAVRDRVAAIVRDTGEDLADVAHAVAVADEPFLSQFTQTRMRTWSTPRTILIGDAAHCIDPLSGLGAHASLLDAAVLADVLVQHESYDDAFADFDARIRPFVEASQKLTARVLEYVTDPAGRTRVRTMASGLGDLAGLAPHLLTSRGRWELAGKPAPTPSSSASAGDGRLVEAGTASARVDGGWCPR